MDATDEFIVKRCLEGDKNAFSELVQRYKDLVYGIGYHYLGDFTEAEDLTQDVFLQAYLKLHQLKDHASFAPWLKRISVNLCKRRLEFRNRGAACLEELSMMPIQVTLNPEEIYARKTLRKQVADALATLAEKNRLTLTLYYIDGLTCQQVSEALEIPVGTVKRRLHIARKQLKEKMKMVVEDFDKNKLQENFTDKVMQRFDEIVNISKEDFWGLLHLVGSRDFAIAIKGANPKVQNSILANVEPVKREELNEKIESIGDLPEEVISNAQQVVLDAVRAVAGKSWFDFEWYLEQLDNEEMRALVKQLQPEDILQAHPPGLRGTVKLFLEQMPPKEADCIARQLDEWDRRRGLAREKAAQIAQNLTGIDKKELAVKLEEAKPEQFCDIVSLPDEVIWMLYCNISHVHFAIALKGASQQVQERIFSVIDAGAERVSVVYPQAKEHSRELKRKVSEMENPSLDARKEAEERALEVARGMINHIRWIAEHQPFHLYHDDLSESQAAELAKQMNVQELADALAGNSINSFELFIRKLPVNVAEKVKKVWYAERDATFRARQRIAEKMK